MKTIHAVLDTNVLVSAMLTPAGNPAKTYAMLLTGKITVVISEAILEEYRDVLQACFKCS